MKYFLVGLVCLVLGVGLRHATGTCLECWRDDLASVGCDEIKPPAHNGYGLKERKNET